LPPLVLSTINAVPSTLNTRATMPVVTPRA
jgi:hypothetical protein